MANIIKKRRLRLTPIHPFTERQAQIIKLLAAGVTQRNIAEILDISPNTLRNHISGVPKKGGGKSALGILGIIEEATKRRPRSKVWLLPLIGDVLLWKKK